MDDRPKRKETTDIKEPLQQVVNIDSIFNIMICIPCKSYDHWGLYNKQFLASSQLRLNDYCYGERDGEENDRIKREKSMFTSFGEAKRDSSYRQKLDHHGELEIKPTKLQLRELLMKILLLKNNFFKSFCSKGFLSTF